MARRIAYTGDPVLTARDVIEWVREDVASLELRLIEDVIIPSVTSMCEAETGAAIREATYVEDWAEGRSSTQLDTGQAKTVESVVLLQGDGVPLTADQYSLQIGQRVSNLVLAAGVPRGPLRITYTAGVDLAAYPSVLSWLLLQAGTLFQQRESLITGTIVAELPLKFIGSMLADIEVPPRF
ncbi:hypothetical protein [Comamonas terrigena]|uniref:hypothetical protein n=1 Tax=Comamonas terrigena TaxID=32013 RepID=UPI002352BB2C|nr:hypothetical protein [Comamonas terrigena]